MTNFTKNQLSKPDKQLPGTYVVDVMLNGVKVSSEPVRFIDCNDLLCPVLTRKMVTDWGINSEYFKDSGDHEASDVLTKPLEEYIPGASARLEPNASKFTLNIAQQYLVRRDDKLRLSSVSQNGIPSLYLSYYYNGQQNNSAQNGKSEQHFLYLNNGLNLGVWRLRQNGYLVKNEGTGPHWRSEQTFVGRDIMPIMSRLMMGQVSTAGRVFDSFDFKGVTLSSIEEMLPDSQRNYAPVITGIALTQATVEIRQGGNLIYQQSVPPGPFSFTDVVPNHSSGDLDVIVRESSGEVRTFIQPYANQPKMVRKGQLRYAVSSGQYDGSEAQSKKPLFVQSEALYGIGNIVSLFGGALVSNDYQSTVSGVGLNLGNFGGISLELDTSRKNAAGLEDSGTGYSSKINYDKYVETTRTSLTASVMENFDKKYSTWSDFQARNRLREGNNKRPDNIRQRWQMSVSQDLADFGSLSLNYYQKKSWNNNYQSKTLNTSYNFYWKGISTNISYSQSDITTGTRYKDNVLALNVTLPFSSLWGSPGQARINQSYSQGRNGAAQNQTTLSGSALRDNNLNYSLTKTYSHQQNGESARVQYDGGYGSLNAAWSQNSGGNHQYSVGASGAVVAHPGGVTLGQSISNNDAFAIISAPGASNVAVTTKSGVKTDWRGYAIVPSLSAYRQNRIGLDPSTAGDNTSLTSTEVLSVPGFGTAINASFVTSIGRKAYLRMLFQNKPLPLGTEFSGSKEGSGIVDEKGFAYLTGLSDGERLSAQVNGQSCNIQIHYNLLTLKKDVYTGSVSCQ